MTAKLKVPARYVLTRDLPMDPYGSIIPKGAACRAYETFDGLVELRFEQKHASLRQWDNTLLLFPDCVEDGIVDSLREVPEASRAICYRSLAACLAALL